MTPPPAEEQKPVGVSVDIHPLVGQVIIAIGDFRIGLPPQEALIMANHLVAAVETLHLQTRRIPLDAQTTVQ